MFVQRDPSIWLRVELETTFLFFFYFIRCFRLSLLIFTSLHPISLHFHQELPVRVSSRLEAEGAHLPGHPHICCPQSPAGGG